MRIGIVAAMAALLTASVTASPAAAHARLVSATPAPDTVVASPARLQLVFSEPLLADSSGVALEMVDMPGMKMTSPMAMPVTTALSADGETMTVTTAQPLPRGGYRLDWHAVTTETHRTEGSFAFKVK